MKKKNSLLHNYDPKATLTREEEIALYNLARQQNERAMRRLLESWNGMFLQIYETFLSFAHNHPTMDQEDIMQEMRLLAIDIVQKDKWNPEGGMRLGTFINGGIRLRIRDIVNKQDSVGSFKNAHQINDLKDGRKVRENVVYMDDANALGVKYQDVVSSETINHISPETTIAAIEQAQALIAGLNDREQMVIIAHFGLFDNLKLTLQEIDEQNGWEPKTAKRIYDNARRKMRQKKS